MHQRAAVAHCETGWAKRLKPREPRRKVLTKARMRVGATWTDTCILNISSRGLMIQAAAPPPRGTYMELRRGSRVIIGRVMWTKQDRCGIKTQDRLDVDAILARPDGAEPVDDASAAAAPTDRRSASRAHEQSFKRSRQSSRAFEFVCIAILGAAGCLLAFTAVERVFEVPLMIIEESLAARKPA